MLLIVTSFSPLTMRTIFLSLLCLISTLHLGATEKAEISVDSLFAAGRYREAAAAHAMPTSVTATICWETSGMLC